MTGCHEIRGVMCCKRCGRQAKRVELFTSVAWDCPVGCGEMPEGNVPSWWRVGQEFVSAQHGAAAKITSLSGSLATVESRMKGFVITDEFSLGEWAACMDDGYWRPLP